MQRYILQGARRAVLGRQTTMVTRAVRPAIFGAKSPVLMRFSSTQTPKSENEDGETAKEAEKAEGEAAGEQNLTPEQQQVQELEAKLAQKDKDLADMKNHYARAVADFRNLQESTKKEVQKARDFALQKFAKDLLESLDNFSLALSAVKEETLSANSEVKNLYEGVDMTRNVFEKTLTRHGIEKIDPMGEPFDPNMHEATFEVPQADKEPGTVFHVQQPGYTLNTRVLRPAKVGLVKGE